ncbi:MAG TPA: ATP phosphoribosyltransferase regulatory subunit [Gammaproteobacteria bacterium]|nr:ATP phosphoribosyltransferase regulatory subunit [Gammaproteobacteria bacterium]
MTIQDRWLLPEGIEEILPPRAGRLEALRRHLLDLYRGWGYELVVPPLIEYLESLLTGTGNDLDLQTFKLIDQLSGRLMGVRADVTPQAARMDAHVLGGEGVRRLCYIETVLHARPDGLGGSRAPMQAGAELFGHGGRESDLEVLALMLETLLRCGLGQIHLDLGHVGVYRALIGEAGLDADAEEELFSIMRRKALPELGDFIGGRGLPRALAGMLRRIPELNGGPGILGQAREALAGAPGGVSDALDELAWLAAQVERRYPDVPVHIDLAELRGYFYHTGAVFAAFQPGHGQALARGGRYDHIGEVFGRARPATGFSTDLGLVLERLGPGETVIDGILAPADAEDEALADVVSALRERGERVVQALPGASDAPAVYACDRRLTRRGGRWVVLGAQQKREDK